MPANATTAIDALAAAAGEIGRRSGRRRAELLCCLLLELCRERQRRSPALADQLVRTAAADWREELAAAAELAWGAGRSRLVERLGRDAGRLQQTAEEAADECRQQPADLFEQFLDAFDPRRRGSHGVYYTPAPLAEWLVEQAHQALRRLGLADGLLDATRWGEFARRSGVAIPADATAESMVVQVVDPAAGSGAFLTALLRWASRQGGPAAAERLLGRIAGNELLPSAAAVCQLRVVWQLLDLGVSPNDSTHIDVAPADTLSGPCLPATADRPATTVVVGNPPYLSASPDRGPWIGRLLRGRGDGPEGSSYFDVDGKPLGERKVWLHDDYVRFLRWSQWRIESTGCGVAALVLNHGFLDNVTFRGARQKLAATFSQIDVLDLHGGAKARERAPDGSPDENVFPVGTGVAACTLARGPGLKQRVRRADLWGPRQDKLQRLADWRRGAGPPWRTLPCSPPEYLFAAPPPRMRGYDEAPLLTELMPVSTTAPVTARDRFLIDISRDRLRERLEQFADLRIPDERIRETHFQRTRSARHQPGDTRGWRLTEARRRLASTPHWPAAIRRCLYRPYDWRHILWLDWMIDWPRTEVAGHLLRPGNVALIARRQMLAARPCDYFWAASEIAIDGVIRSDNRGSESLFPLWLHDGPRRRANFDHRLAERFAERAGLRWVAGQDGDLQRTVGPPQLLGYLYAVFHAPSYRLLYAPQLRRAFPRVPLADRRRFVALSRRGSQLLRLHAPTAEDFDSQAGGAEVLVSQLGSPAFGDGRIVLADDVAVPASRETWEFHVGGHQVARKWLKDRRGLPLTTQDLACYQRILDSLQQSRRVMQAIEETVRQTGGWEDQ